MTAPDPILAVLDAFQDHTGRLTISPADHAQAKAWVDAGMPLGVILKGMEDKMYRASGKWYLRTMKLEWCDQDVRHAFIDYRRAIGPRRQLQVEVRG